MLAVAALATLFLSHLPLLHAASSSAAPCPATLTPTHSIQPSIASGYRAALVATGLTKPRSIQFDSAGNLLVVEQGAGITALTLQDDGGTCVSVKGSKRVIDNTGLNHGIALSPDGKTLYASTTVAAYSWPYDVATSSVGPTNTTLVSGMNTQDHTTRTLLIPQKASNMLVISRGSTSNIDLQAEQLSSGHSQVRAFDLTSVTSKPYNYDTDGVRLGWGLRNSVGVGEHPLTGGIFTVENSADEITRQGVNIHQDNPGEELNFLGYLNGTQYADQGRNFGYPLCFAAWDLNTIPGNGNLTVGSQFVIGTPNNTVNDGYCERDTVAPRLTFQAHMAPLDIKFNNSGAEGWVTFHGSWDRTSPVGYKVSVIAFENGSPVAPADSNTSATDIFANADNSKCPDNCLRPVGIAFDNHGRMFISSDASGEVYVVVKDQATTAPSSTSTGSVPSSTPTGSAPASTASASAAERSTLSYLNIVVTINALLLASYIF